MNTATENLSDSDKVISAKRRLPRTTTLPLVLLLGSASVVGICLWILSLVDAEFSLTHITVLRPGITPICYGGVFLGYVFCVITVAWLCSRYNVELGISIVVLGCCAPIVIAYCSLIPGLTNPPEWSVARELAGLDGATYSLLNAAHFRDYSLALARQTEESAITRDLDIFTPVGGRYSTIARVIRPANALQRGRAQLYVSESGVLVAIYKEWCHFTYDTKTNEYVGGMDAGNTHPSLVSPFVLIGAKTAMYQPDVDALLKSVSRGYGGRFGPDEKYLTEALDHPNPEVRKLVRRIAELYGTDSTRRRG